MDRISYILYLLASTDTDRNYFSSSNRVSLLQKNTYYELYTWVVSLTQLYSIDFVSKT